MPWSKSRVVISFSLQCNAESIRNLLKINMKSDFKALQIS